jgi:hypothetical protein
VDAGRQVRTGKAEFAEGLAIQQSFFEVKAFLSEW